jgi:hypothetical protein
MRKPAVPRPTEEIADFFARGPSVEEIVAFHLSEATIARVRELLDKNASGTLTRQESEELDELVLLDRIVLLIRSRLPREGVQQGPATTRA